MCYFILGLYISVCVIWAGYSFCQEHFYKRRPTKAWYIITTLLMPSSAIMLVLFFWFKVVDFLVTKLGIEHFNLWD